MTSDAEQAILDKYKAEVATKQAERERQRLQEKERKEQRKKERTELKEEKKRVEAALGKKISNIDEDDIEDEVIVDDKPSVRSVVAIYDLKLTIFFCRLPFLWSQLQKVQPVS